MFRLWCEWDCGQEAVAFTSRETAKKFFNTNPMNVEYFEDERSEGDDQDNAFDFFVNEGLVSLEELKVI